MNRTEVVAVAIVRSLRQGGVLVPRELRDAVSARVGRKVNYGDIGDAARLLRHAGIPLMCGIGNRWRLGDDLCSEADAAVQVNRVLIKCHSYAVAVYRSMKRDRPEQAMRLVGMIRAIEEEIEMEVSALSTYVPLSPAVEAALMET